jgi:short chain dehydrogenase
MSDKKTAIVTGAQQGIGAGLVEAFLKDGYNVVATSLNVSESLTPSPSLVLVDGDIGKQETAGKAVEAAVKHFGTIDVLVNNAGIFYTKPFTDFTTENFNALDTSAPLVKMPPKVTWSGVVTGSVELSSETRTKGRRTADKAVTDSNSPRMNASVSNACSTETVSGVAPFASSNM